MIRAACACALAAAALATCSAEALGAPSESRPTPRAITASATARSAVLAIPLRKGLRRLMRGAGRASGAWVADVPTGAGARILFRKAAGKSRKLASNTKLFTTSTALVKFGPTAHLPTSAWANGTITDGILSGNLVLRGGGDPELNDTQLATLAGRVAAAGVTQVAGHLLYDETYFDAKPGIPESGVTGGLGADLSGLYYSGGARKAASDFVDDLHARGIAVSRDVQSGQAFNPAGTPLATVDSLPMAQLVKDTNVPSNNFMAEMLLKGVGAKFGSGGSTAGGLGVVQPFASGRGAFLLAENGSGLSIRDRASPAGVGRLLVSMLREPSTVSSAWTGSLAVAGQTGTLTKRMRGTAAAGRCHAKTGTLSGVSALSGYCFGVGHTTVFSILNNKASITRAHLIQDRMAALIARFQP